VAYFSKDEFRVEGTTVTHLPSGASWRFSFDSPNPYRSDAKKNEKPMTITEAAKEVWALHIRTVQGIGVANKFSGQATL
jgi:hypothetical protein